MLILIGVLMLLTILFFLGSLSLHPLEGRSRWGGGGIRVNVSAVPSPPFLLGRRVELSLRSEPPEICLLGRWRPEPSAPTWWPDYGGRVSPQLRTKTPGPP